MNVTLAPTLALLMQLVQTRTEPSHVRAILATLAVAINVMVSCEILYVLAMSPTTVVVDMAITCVTGEKIVGIF